MRFVCLQCAAKIVSDDKNMLCPGCGNPPIKATESYAGIMMSPNIAIQRFTSAVQKYGYEQALTRRARQEREAWIAAVWALCMRQETGREYWVEVETQELTPDCKVHYIDQSRGGNQCFTHNLEIVEWDHHRDDVMEVVRQKCARAYPAFFTLVVLARNGTKIDLPLKGLESLKVPFCEMWFLGRESPDTTTYRAFLFHPREKLMEFDLFDAMRKNSSQINFLTRTGRGRETEFTNLGQIYLPLGDE